MDGESRRMLSVAGSGLNSSCNCLIDCDFGVTVWPWLNCNIFCETFRVDFLE